MEAEPIRLSFVRGRTDSGFTLVSSYNNELVEICRQRFCDLCNLAEREKIRSLRQGGEFDVILTAHRRPSFWEEKNFFLAHIISIPERVVGVDEGVEADYSRANPFILSTDKGGILIDPGFAGFNGREESVQQLIAGHRIAAVIISHGHLDHWNRVGSLRFSVPVFMTRLTYNLISRHNRWERGLEGVLERARKITPGEAVFLPHYLPLRVKTITLPHSIPETLGLIIEGRKKRVVHLGDFKFSGMEVRQKAETIDVLSDIARESVDLLCLNIINAHIGGYTPLEAGVIDALTNVFAESKGRVVIACFSTNLERIRRIYEVSQLLKRPVVFAGAGMHSAKDFLGLNNRFPEIVDYSDIKAVVFTTGCQAEEGSVLWRIAENNNPPFELRKTDTLVFSSRCIPGNEEGMKKLISGLQPQVGRIIVNKGDANQLDLEGVGEAFTHVSGHGHREDIRLALDILKPKQVLPWPQTEPQISSFKEIAEPLGIKIVNEKERVIEV